VRQNSYMLPALSCCPQRRLKTLNERRRTRTVGCRDAEAPDA
jgi:hypothetical protein